ncbi:N-acetylmuramoyl-L-alanine amidase [Roseicyclus persicicus]|uniref:N-acetylmuramoyl-L-alanine amidase n=1 Tax=Roseicyclus persicicus TaxID=2650661 RepID=A0A7X6H3B9_9RHOB|nr:N-acetylmuramoyl-L-alanine amidase [Roseibacterium persicicum]NKX46388.1 N-acetylmuramoyl-L-alanine amidase [Roseibacterium persicicum]
MPLLAALAVCLTALAAPAQGFGALARLLPEETRLHGGETGIDITLGLSQPVPFRVFTLADPARVVVDFREVAFGDWADTADLPPGIEAMEAGPARTAGWSRLVLTLSAPFAPTTAAMTTDPATGRAAVALRLVPVPEAEFRAAAGTPPEATAPPAVLPEGAGAAGDGRLVVVLDPGHGGVDPGAVRGEHTEADLVLTFARELRDALRRSGRAEVVLTRDADLFVPLPTRVTLARAAGADLFISIHADALAEGTARGATVYTLSDTASDAAAEALAEQHDRADLLQGIDLHGADDVVAGVLMDLARLETAPRSAALATALVEGIGAAGLRLHPDPQGEAGFTVLRAADIPSVLLEIGFMSDARDLGDILDPDWRAQMQAALVEAILGWAEADAARMALARQ